MSDVEEMILSFQKEAYHQGCIDTLENIKKSMIKVRDVAHKNPTMEEFINVYIPAFIDIENKSYKKIKELNK